MRQMEATDPSSAATAGGPSSLSLVTPGEIRSQSVAIFTAVVTVVGPIFGPPIIGWAVDNSGDPKFVGTALSAFVVVLGVPSILFVLWARGYYRTAVIEMEESLKAQALKDGAAADGEAGPATA